MFRPLKTRAPQRQPVIKSVSLPAPVGGWDTESALTEMPKDRAPILDNMIPRVQRVDLRRGHASHATGLTGAVESLMAWNGPSSGKMFASSGSSAGSYAVHEVTASGAVGGAVLSTLQGKRWQAVNFATSGGHFLWMANGADSPRHYDGTTWATPTLTGITPANVLAPIAYRRRLFLLFNSGLDFGYLPADSIAGVVSTFPLGGVLRRGGRLVAAGTWSLDNGGGLDDHIVFFTSEGQAAVYTGTDPSAPNGWSLVGVYDLHPPLSVRSVMKAGGDLVVMTRYGAISMARSFALALAAQEASAVTTRINRAIEDAATAQPTAFGWNALTYPKAGLVLINVPQSSTTFHQYVMNLETGGWCRFTGWNGYTFLAFNDRLFFGGSGVVYEADKGTHDNGAAITWDMQTAWQYYGERGALKRIVMLRPHLLRTGGVIPAIEVKVDFDTSPATVTPTLGMASGAVWDTSLWDVGRWGGEERYKSWTATSALGYAIALRVRGQSATDSLSLEGFDVQFEPAVAAAPL